MRRKRDATGRVAVFVLVAVFVYAGAFLKLEHPALLRELADYITVAIEMVVRQWRQ